MRTNWPGVGLASMDGISLIDQIRDGTKENKSPADKATDSDRTPEDDLLFSRSGNDLKRLIAGSLLLNEPSKVLNKRLPRDDQQDHDAPLVLDDFPTKEILYLTFLSFELDLLFQYLDF